MFQPGAIASRLGGRGQPVLPSRPNCLTMSYMDALTIRIPKELAKKLEQICKRQHRSTSEVVRESLRRYLDLEQLREIREQLRPHAEAAGVLTDDDIFKAVS